MKVRGIFTREGELGSIHGRKEKAQRYKGRRGNGVLRRIQNPVWLDVRSEWAGTRT